MQYNYLLKYIGNMNKILMWFNLPNNIIINKKREKTVSIHTTEYKWIFFTVILEYIADGKKLPAVCIFKLKKILKEKFPDGIYVHVNEKEWVNENKMLW